MTLQLEICSMVALDKDSIVLLSQQKNSTAKKTWPSTILLISSRMSLTSLANPIVKTLEGVGQVCGELMSRTVRTTRSSIAANEPAWCRSEKARWSMVLQSVGLSDFVFIFPILPILRKLPILPVLPVLPILPILPIPILTFRIPSKWLQNTFKRTSNYLQNTFRIPSKWFQNTFRLASKYLQTTFKISPEYHRNTFIIPSECFQNAFRITSEHLKYSFITLSK